MTFTSGDAAYEILARSHHHYSHHSSSFGGSGSGGNWFVNVAVGLGLLFVIMTLLKKFSSR